MAIQYDDVPTNPKYYLKSNALGQKTKGVKLGRPKGSKKKKGRILDAHKPAIKKYLELGVTISDITKIINDLLEKPITYNAFKYFIKHDEELAPYMAKSKNQNTKKS